MKGEVFLPSFYLEVGFTADGRRVLVNHPFLQQDASGGHIEFTPAEARNLGKLLLRKAAELERLQRPAALHHADLYTDAP